MLIERHYIRIAQLFHLFKQKMPDRQADTHTATLRQADTETNRLFWSVQA